MSLELDKRQRAMLREMGVRVWQPVEPVAAPAAAPAVAPMPAVPEAAGATASAQVAVAIDSVAGRARPAVAAGTFVQKPTPLPATRPDAAALSNGAAWSMGQALALYADAAPADGPRWLVLAETPASALQPGAFNPFEGDAGKLLDNMLRAARLNRAGAVTLAPLVRRGASDASRLTELSALSALVLETRPDVVLVMGRLAAQALLQSNEPFGRLRGQVHKLHGIQTIVTHDAPYLLRTPLDKAKAWEDLCLAISVAGAA